MATESTLKNIELVFWNTPDSKDIEARPTIEQTRQKLREAGLPDRHADYVPEKTAFRLAANQVRGRGIECKVFDVNGDLFLQVDRVQGEKDTESAKLKRTIVGVWEHTVNGPKQVRGYDPEMNAQVRLEYDTAKTTYDFSDIGRILMKVLTAEGLGIYSPRKAGGVYFVPTDEQCAELLNKVEEFCTSLGVRLLRYPVQNTDAQKAEIADAVAGGIEVDVEEHIKAVEKYSPTTRQDVFAHRRELIRQTALLLIRLSLFLNGRANELGRKLEECESRMKTLESQASVASQSSGRRILPAKAG